jgi:hypothetical protein
MLYAHVYSRQQDAETGIHVAVILEHQEVTTRSSLHKNPSPRRGGVSMTMVCADCSYIFEMSYYQHKGQILSSMYDEMKLYRVLEKDDKAQNLD